MASADLLAVLSEAVESLGARRAELHEPVADRAVEIVVQVASEADHAALDRPNRSANARCLQCRSSRRQRVARHQQHRVRRWQHRRHAPTDENVGTRPRQRCRHLSRHHRRCRSPIVQLTTYTDVCEAGSARCELEEMWRDVAEGGDVSACLLYTSPSPRDRTRSRMPSSA